MGTSESDRGLRKQLVVVESARRHPSVRAERRSNGVPANKTRIREVSSRYMSTSISTPSAVKRCPSPVPKSNTLAASVVDPKRAVSAERKRPSTPPSPSRISTPVRDVDASLTSRKMPLTTQPKSLWPSTTRSLSVSFQSDGHPNPTAKEKTVTRSLAERSLRLSSNASHKQPESPLSARKAATPDRRTSPLKGKSLLDQTENTLPDDGSQIRSSGQHRWPSRIGGKISSSSLNRSFDFTDMTKRNPSASLSRIGIPSLRRLSDGMSKPIQKTSSDVANQVSSDPSILQRKNAGLHSSTDLTNLLKFPELRKAPQLNSSDRSRTSNLVVRSESLPQSRHPSPIRTASQSKVSSPSISRPVTPSRGVSPSRLRPASPSSQSSSSNSVLSFVTDIRKPKKNNQLEDAHQLRLLYNRHLQWRFANAQTAVALQNQKLTAERSLNNAWGSKLDIWNAVTKKKIQLRQMRLELKLNLILNEQQHYLDDWASLEREHSLSLAGIVNDLEGGTLRLPLTGGAKADIESLKVAMCSAMDVMQSMGPSVITLLSMTESMNSLVCRLANLAVQERAMLNECEGVLAQNDSMQVEENSIRTHLIQTQV